MVLLMFIGVVLIRVNHSFRFRFQMVTIKWGAVYSVGTVLFSVEIFTVSYDIKLIILVSDGKEILFFVEIVVASCRCM